MEKLCIHIICDNPRAYKALESVCLEHAGAFFDFEQSYESWCSQQQYKDDEPEEWNILDCAVCGRRDCEC